MPKVEFDMDCRVPPEKVRAALLDFSPGRPETWPGIFPPMYEVYDVGETYADIREGSKAPEAPSGPKNITTGQPRTPSPGPSAKAISAHRAATSRP